MQSLSHNRLIEKWNSPFFNQSVMNAIPFDINADFILSTYGNPLQYYPIQVLNTDTNRWNVLPCPATFWNDRVLTYNEEPARTRAGNMPNINNGSYEVPRAFMSWNLLSLRAYNELMRLIQPRGKPNQNEFRVRYLDLMAVDWLTYDPIANPTNGVVIENMYLYPNTAEPRQLWIGGKDHGIIQFKCQFVGTNNNYVFMQLINTTPSMGEVQGGGSLIINESYTIVATPYDGYEFVNWQGGDGTILSTNASYTFTLTTETPLVIYAYFQGATT